MSKTSKYCLGLFLSLPLFIFVWLEGLNLLTAFASFCYFWIGFSVGEQKEN